MKELPTEKDYEEFERLGAKLHIATPTAFWNMKVERLDTGEELLNQRERAHSWVRNSYNYLVGLFGGVGGTTATFADGFLSGKVPNGSVYGNVAYACGYSASDVENPVNITYYGAPVSSVTAGLIVGTGTAAYSFDDYKLEALVPSGTSSGSLSYQASTASKTWDSVNRKWVVVQSRIFNNNSGSSISIKEVGLLNNTRVFSGLTYAFLFVRDLLETPVEVPSASKLTLSYTIEVLYPNA